MSKKSPQRNFLIKKVTALIFSGANLPDAWTISRLRQLETCRPDDFYYDKRFAYLISLLFSLRLCFYFLYFFNISP